MSKDRNLVTKRCHSCSAFFSGARGWFWSRELHELLLAGKLAVEQVFCPRHGDIPSPGGWSTASRGWGGRSEHARSRTNGIR